MNTGSILAVVTSWAAMCAGSTLGQYIGPTPYLCFDDAATTATGDCAGHDSPFTDVDFSGGYLHLEDFEDAVLNIPGVTAPVGGVFGPQHFFTDSVDEDDGAIDQSGSAGHSWGIVSGSVTLDFIFDAGTLGTLPSHVGIVATDGFGVTTFEAFDAAGASMGMHGPFDLFLGFNNPPEINGYTGGIHPATGQEFFEDHFFGVINHDGISRIRLTQAFGGFEVDHLQYGRQTCPWDLNGDGVVDVADLFQVIMSWGPCAGCPEDLDGDGVVGGLDVAAVATHFGSCP